VSSEDVAECYAAADICLAPLRDLPDFHRFIPSKIFEVLAHGRPLIACLREAAAILVANRGRDCRHRNHPEFSRRRSTRWPPISRRAAPGQGQGSGVRERAIVHPLCLPRGLGAGDRQMTVLVIGGAGFTGRRVLPLLRQRATELRALVRSDSARATVEALGVPAVMGDLADPDSLSRALAGATDLVMLASLGFGHAPALVEAAQAHGIQRALFVGTTAVFTRITASSKAVRLEAEKVIQSSRLAWTLIRPTMIYGAPGDRNMERLLRYVKRIPLFPVPGSGRHLLQPVHVEDLARGIVEAFGSEKTHRRCYDLPAPSGTHFERSPVWPRGPPDEGSCLSRPRRGVGSPSHLRESRKEAASQGAPLRLNEDGLPYASRISNLFRGITEEARLLFVSPWPRGSDRGDGLPTDCRPRDAASAPQVGAGHPQSRSSHAAPTRVAAGSWSLA
jgi:uncharacterized protein YbjT (DUF2867 family)